MASLYLSVNKIFADKVISPDDDFVCVHVYHLMVLPTFLRKRFNRVNLGFFLDIPFPSSEIYRPLPIVKPARGRGKDVQEVQSETETTTGASRVNPWNIDAVTEAMSYALILSKVEKQMRHEQYTSFRILALDPSFKKISVEHTVSAYKRTKNRAILVDYYGTMVVH
ncbi:unnamed protein product [Brassica oleracea]